MCTRRRVFRCRYMARQWHVALIVNTIQATIFITIVCSIMEPFHYLCMTVYGSLVNDLLERFSIDLYALEKTFHHFQITFCRDCFAYFIVHLISVLLQTF